MDLPQSILYKIDIFHNLSTKQVDLLLEAATVKRLQPNEVLFSAGSRGNCLYVVLQGTLTAGISGGGNTDKRVSSLSAGDSFGEIAMLTGCERTATIQSVTPALVMQVTKDSIQKAGLGSIIYQNIARVLAERLMKMNEKAAKTEGFVETVIGYADDLAAHQSASQARGRRMINT